VLHIVFVRALVAAGGSTLILCLLSRNLIFYM